MIKFFIPTFHPCSLADKLSSRYEYTHKVQLNISSLDWHYFATNCRCFIAIRFHRHTYTNMSISGKGHHIHVHMGIEHCKCMASLYKHNMGSSAITFNSEAWINHPRHQTFNFDPFCVPIIIDLIHELYSRQYNNIMDYITM